MTKRLSVSHDGSTVTGGSLSPSISENGRYVAFHSTANNLVAGDAGNTDVFVYDTQMNTIRLVSVSSPDENDQVVKGNGNSTSAQISADGNWVVYAAMRPN